LRQVSRQGQWQARWPKTLAFSCVTSLERGSGVAVVPSALHALQPFELAACSATGTLGESVTPFLHQPFWCEENVWHLAQHAATQAPERLVLVLTGAGAQVACWHQKAGDPGRPILWDYHVVLATRTDARGWQVWDLDSRVGIPVEARAWLQATFPAPDQVPRPYQPRFAAIPADDYVRGFGSDRAHMRDSDGSWMQQPPPWPTIAGGGLTLTEALEQARRGLDLAKIAARLL
jgi:hypothetical protein